MSRTERKDPYERTGSLSGQSGFFDQLGILIPTALAEGGRRLYSEENMKRIKIICFLRNTGLSLDTISQLLKEEDPGSMIPCGVLWSRYYYRHSAYICPQCHEVFRPLYKEAFLPIVR